MDFGFIYKNKRYVRQEILKKFAQIVRKYTSGKEYEQIKDEFLSTYKQNYKGEINEI